MLAPTPRFTNADVVLAKERSCSVVAERRQRSLKIKGSKFLNLGKGRVTKTMCNESAEY